MFDPALSPKRVAPDKPDRGERSRMNVSPLDLRQQRFRKAFRGFDPVEVASFLAAVARRLRAGRCVRPTGCVRI